MDRPWIDKTLPELRKLLHTVPTQRRNEIIYEIEQKEAHEAVVTVKALTRVLAWLTIAIAALTVVLVIKEFI